MRCAATTRDGRECRANATTGSPYCLLHGDSEKARLLGARGGRRRAITLPIDLKRIPAPKSAADVRNFVATYLGELRSGNLESGVGRTLFYGLTVLLRAIELSDHEMRLQRLEALAAKKKGQS
jgi:hypothetical protein